LSTLRDQHREFPRDHRLQLCFDHVDGLNTSRTPSPDGECFGGSSEVLRIRRIAINRNHDASSVSHWYFRAELHSLDLTTITSALRSKPLECAFDR